MSRSKINNTLVALMGVVSLSVSCSVLHAQQTGVQPSALPEVAVTATRFREPYAEQPVNITVIDAQAIAQSPARTVPELLAQQAGITVRDLFGNNASNATVDLRGFGADADQNTLILVDGRRVTDIDLSGVQWSALPLVAIERIEILRGSGAVLYGNGASAGVINIITRSPVTGGHAATFSARAGSYGTFEAQSDANVVGDTLGLNVSASNYTSNGYRDNNENRQTNGLADARWLTAGGEIDFKIAADRQGMRLPGARAVQPSIGLDELADDRRGTSTPLDWAQRDGNQALFDWRQNVAFGEFDIGVGYRDKQQAAYFDFGGFPDYRETRLGVWSFTPRLRIAVPVFGRDNSLAIGFDTYHWDYRLHKTDTPADIEQPVNSVAATQDTNAFYVHDTLQLTQAATLSAGVRREHLEIRADDHFDATAPGGAFGSGAPTGSQSASLSAYDLGLHYQWLPALAWTAAIGRSYRYATVDEIYETTPFFTAQFQFLRPQINRSAELGGEWRQARGGLRVSVFNIDIHDEIHLDAYTAGIGNTNLPPSRRRGIELQGHWQPSEAVALSAAWTYTDARFREGVLPGGFFTATNVVIAGKFVPLVPRHKADLGASWAYSPQTRVSATGTWVGAQYMDNDEGNTFGTRIPSYAVADIKLTHDIGDLRLSAAINNLFDRDYYTYAVRSQFTSDRYNAYPLPGRTAWLTVEYAFR